MEDKSAKLRSGTGTGSGTGETARLAESARTGAPRTFHFRGASGLDTLSQHYEYSAPDPPRFRATMRSSGVDSVAFDRITASPYAILSTPEMARDVPWHGLHVSTLQEGHAIITQCGRTARFGPGEISFVNSSEPFRAQMPSGTRVTTITVPMRYFRREHAALDALVAVRLAPDPIASGLAAFLSALGTEGPRARPSDAELIAHGVIDVLRAILRRQRVDAPDSQLLAALTRDRVLAHIDDHLTEPDLGPESIAAAFGVSVRYVHRLFENEEHTVARAIRRHRVERLADALANGTESLAELAARLGFPSAESARRAFRADYAFPPHEYRRMVSQLSRDASLHDLLR